MSRHINVRAYFYLDFIDPSCVRAGSNSGVVIVTLNGKEVEMRRSQDSYSVDLPTRDFLLEEDYNFCPFAKFTGLRQLSSLEEFDGEGRQARVLRSGYYQEEEEAAVVCAEITERLTGTKPIIALEMTASPGKGHPLSDVLEDWAYVRRQILAGKLAPETPYGR